MSARLQGKVVIVTGAAQGIGASTAREFAQQGTHVALIDIDDAAAKKVAAKKTPAVIPNISVPLKPGAAAHRLAEALGVTEHKTGIKVERS
mgnify:CR=1 FL=1